MFHNPRLRKEEWDKLVKAPEKKAEDDKKPVAPAPPARPAGPK